MPVVVTGQLSSSVSRNLFFSYSFKNKVIDKKTFVVKSLRPSRPRPEIVPNPCKVRTKMSVPQ